MLLVKYFPFQRYYLFTLEDWVALQVRPEEIPKTIELLYGLGYRTTLFYLNGRFTSQKRLLEHARNNRRRPQFIQSTGAWSYIP
tara:strand:- start:797 stop:1048 length:252 start_codon:yes stop_codon:yes gene_type:complete